MSEMRKLLAFVASRSKGILSFTADDAVDLQLSVGRLKRKRTPYKRRRFWRKCRMSQISGLRVNRRQLVVGSIVLGSSQIAAPFIVGARGEVPIKLGMIDPLTGVYAAIAQSEVEGAKFAVEQINRNGGVLGRQIELLVEDSANDVGTGVQKARKLIERDQVNLIIGDVNSGIALAIAGVTAEKKVLHIVSGGHTDALTGKDCHWNMFRVCNTTTMDVNAIADTLISKFGKKWYFLTPDYAYGHSVQDAFVKKLKSAGGEFAGDLIPLGTADYSANLIKAKAYGPKVLINVMGGGDQVNSLKQFVQFGLDKQMAVGGTLFELESLRAVPPEARIGWWTMEWWWDQPGNAAVKNFVADVKKVTGKTPSARTWFGYVSVQTFAQAANQHKTIDGPALARALEGFKLPPDVALLPGETVYRAGDHQLMSAVLPGEAHNAKEDPDDMFAMAQPVPGETAAGPTSATGCTIKWPI
jgi:branched-chain amino acid transport system substrate-binding protein